MYYMKHLMRYEGYTAQQRVDDVLDKISKYGISSLREDEKEFLNAHRSGNEEEIHQKMVLDENETIFEDDNGYFDKYAKDEKGIEHGNERIFSGE